MGIRDWDIVTSYVDSVTTTLKTVTFPKVQESVKVKNQGNVNLTYTIGSQSGALTPGQSVTVKESLSSFTIQAVSGSQSFEVKAIEQGTEIVDTNNIDMTNQQPDTSLLRKWRAKRAKALASNYKAQINIAGDSISEGAYSGSGSSDWITKGYVGRIRSALASKYGDCGTGIIPAAFPNGSPYLVSSGFSLVPGGTPGCGFGNYYYQSNVLGSTLTYTFNGTGVEIYYVQGTAVGNFNYSVDGGSAVGVTARVNPTNYAQKVQITGLTDGTHTIVITQNFSGSNVQITGACPIKGSNGIQVNLVGKYGTTVDAMSRDNCLSAEFGLIPPDLTIIALTANDFGNQTDLPTYQANLQKIIGKAKLSGDVLITTIGVRNEVKTISQTEYINICKSLAQSNNCAYIDIYSRWNGASGAVESGYFYDTVHPNDIGHQDIATAILKVIDEY